MGNCLAPPRRESREAGAEPAAPRQLEPPAAQGPAAGVEAAGSFVVGERVCCRNDGGEWRSGFVTSAAPLLVTASQLDPNSTGFAWSEVREFTSNDDGDVGAQRWNGQRFVPCDEDDVAEQLATIQEWRGVHFTWRADLPFSIRVSSITGATELEVTARQTAAQLRRLIQTKLGTAPDEQKLRLEGGESKPLDNDEGRLSVPLGACGVKEGSVIHLTPQDGAKAAERRKRRAKLSGVSFT